MLDKNHSLSALSDNQRIHSVQNVFVLLRSFEAYCKQCIVRMRACLCVVAFEPLSSPYHIKIFSNTTSAGLTHIFPYVIMAKCNVSECEWMLVVPRRFTTRISNGFMCVCLAVVYPRLNQIIRILTAHTVCV